MFEIQKAKVGIAVSLALSCAHYGSNAIVWGEQKIAEHYSRAENEVAHRVASRFGYVRAVTEKTWQAIADEQAELRGVNKCLVRAVIKVESVDGTALVSRAGALGHMQVMRDTARRACDIKSDSDRLDPEQNIFCGVKVLASNIKQYGLIKGLKVYNAGPTRVDATAENRAYPEKILREWSKCNA
jgi:soluble lytic murein transglycosylase-like protein